MKLRVLDLETTSLEATGHVLEVGWRDFAMDGFRVLDGGSYLCGAPEVPPEVRAIHHIRAMDVAGLPPFDSERVVQDALDAGIAGIASHHWGFDGQWLQRQLDGVLPVMCTYKAALRAWPEAPSHSNWGLLYWLEDQGMLPDDLDPLEFGPPHRAGADSHATAYVLQALYKAGYTGKQMVPWTSQPKLLPRCPIGDEWRGKPWAEVDGGFLRWMADKHGMEEDYRWLARRELERRASCG